MFSPSTPPAHYDGASEVNEFVFRTVQFARILHHGGEYLSFILVNIIFFRKWVNCVFSSSS